MRLICGYIKEETFEGIVLDKISDDRFRLIDEVELQLNSLNDVKEDVYACIHISDLTIEKVSIPPVGNKASEEFLIKSKLAKEIEGNIDDYYISFFEEGIINSNLVVNTILIRKDLIHLDEASVENLKRLSISAYGIASISSRVESNNFVFHFYSTDEYVIIVASKGKYIDYIRFAPVPDYATTQEALENFYYETLNLTYLYLRQNRNISIDLILLSGNIVGMSEIIENIYSLTQIPIISINPKYFVVRSNEETVNKYLPAIGTIFLDDSLDIRPYHLLQRKRFESISRYFALTALLLNIAVTAVILKDIYEYTNLVEERNRKEILLDSKMSIVKREIKYTKEELDYFIRYAKMYDENYRFTFFDFIKDIEELLEFQKFSEVKFTKSERVFSLTLKNIVKFESLIALDEFNRRLLDILNKYSSKYKVNNNTKIDINKLEASIDINIVKKRK